MKKSSVKESSLDVLRLQWSLGSEIIEVMEVYPIDAGHKADVLDVIVRDLRARMSYKEDR